MLTCTWSKLKSHYYTRRNNKVPEEYYKGKFTCIENFFKTRDFNEENVDEFFEYLKISFEEKNKKKISNSYYNKYLSVMKVVGRKEGVTFVDDYKAKNIEEDSVKTEKMNIEECEKFFSICCLYKTKSNERDFFVQLLIKILIITTCRPSSLRYVMNEDIRDNYMYFRKELKNGRPYKVYLPDNIIKDIKKLKKFDHGLALSNDARGSFDLDWLNEEIKKRCKIVGITKKITSKSMRGTGATLYLKKYHLHEVQKITNHKSADVLANHYYDPENEQIDNIVKYNPLSPDAMTETFVLDYIPKLIKELQRYGCEAKYVHDQSLKKWIMEIRY